MSLMKLSDMRWSASSSTSVRMCFGTSAPISSRRHTRPGVPTAMLHRLLTSDEHHVCA
jgi:hypothetical protein